jgi:hypothetical protein
VASGHPSGEQHAESANATKQQSRERMRVSFSHTSSSG